MKLKFANALSLALIVAMFFTSIGLADNLKDNATSAGLDVITAGGSTTIKYWIQSQGACEAADLSPSTVTIIVPADVSVDTDPSTSGNQNTLTFTACNTSSEGNPNNTQNAVFSSSTSGSYSITHSVSDPSGAANANPANFILTVNSAPNTAPTLTLPGNINEEATSAAGAVVTYTATATDAQDDPDPTPSCSPASGSAFPLGTTAVNCSVTDSGGLIANGSFNVTVQDTTGPAITVPGNLTVEAVSSSGATVTYTASASDLVSGSVAVNCSPASGSTFGLGSTPVTCSASDGAGNSSSASFSVLVHDTTAPVLALPGNLIAEATSDAGAAVTFSASATDAVDGNVAISCSPASGTTFPLGTTSVSCSATDAAGNLATGGFSVTVQDTTPPTISGTPSNITAEATSAAGAAVSYAAPTANDLVDGSVPVSCLPASGATFALGETTVTCTAMDAHSNSAQTTFKVTVQDTTPPAVIVPSDITAEATGPSGAVVTFSASASDLVDGAVAVACLPASGSTFPLGTTLITCTATDAHGNIGSGSFNVNVQDTTAPIIADNLDIMVAATGPNGAVVNFSNPSATDTVDTSVDVVCVPASGSTFAPGHTTVVCTATDDSGNSAQSSFDVWVKYQLRGFYQPVDMGILNNVKGGSTVPLKFEIFAGSTEFTNTNIISAFTQRISCAAGVGDDIETYATGSTTLRYDTTSGQFIFNWQTLKQPGACYRVTLTTQDGSSIYADFRLK